MIKLASYVLFSEKCGYSLIELLIAVTILGLVVAPFLGLFGGSYNAIFTAGRETEALHLCQQKVESLKTKGYEQVYDDYINSGNSLQTEQNLPGAKGFVRSTSVSTPAPPDNGNNTYPQGLLQIEVTTSFETPGREHAVKLATYLGER